MFRIMNTNFLFSVSMNMGFQTTLPNRRVLLLFIVLSFSQRFVYGFAQLFNY